MEEDTNDVVVEDVIAEAPPQDIALEELNHQPSAQAAQEDSSGVNLRRLREAKEKAERERSELAARLEKYERAASAPQEEEPDYGDEDLVEGKHLKKEIDTVKRQLEAYKNQQIATSDEAKLKNVYKDFDSVVNPETIEKLKALDPETAETIALSSASLFTRGSAAYKRIKELGLSVEDKHGQDRAKAHENASKPKPSNSISPQQGNSPLSMANAFANGLTSDMKKQLWKEMQESAKRF